MHRRRALVALASLTACAVLAPARPLRADLAPSPPPLVELRGERSMVTVARGAPTHAFFTIQNRGSRTVRVRLVSAICRWDGMRLPLRIDAVLQRAGGGALGRELELAPGQRIELEVHVSGFSDPASRGSSWAIELRADVRGERDGRVEAVAEVSRGIRHPVRH